ncbi:MAG: hypothetical protein QG615_277, partial [Nitrospirota bacterium]|nr:hypothetical protein [Nitrospirota bacterium]
VRETSPLLKRGGALMEELTPPDQDGPQS